MSSSRELATLSDERLLLRFRDLRDEAAFALLFQRRAEPLRRAARLLGVAPAEVEDLVQSTFLQALRSVGAFDVERSLRAWLHGILVNQVRMARRHSARRPRAALPLCDEDAPCRPRDLLEETRAGLRQAVAGLPSPYREVVSLRFEHGLDTATIARRLARTEGTVRKQTERGLELLRRTLPVGVAGGMVLALTSGAPRAAARPVAWAARPRVAVAAVLGATLGMLALAWGGVPSDGESGAGLAVAPRPAPAAVGASALPMQREAVVAAPPAVAPAAGRRLHLRHPDGSAARGVPMQVLRRDLPLQTAQLQPLATLQSDADGGLALPQLAVAACALSLAGALPRRHLQVNAPTGDDGWVVPAARRVDGTVVDADGRPVADAAIVVSATGGQGDVGDVVARSDALGRFAATLVCEQPSLWAHAVGRCASVVVPLPDGGEAVRLCVGDLGVTLTGRVGSACGALRPRATLVAWFPRLQSAPLPPAYGLVDDDGGFTLTDLPSGDGLLVVHHPGRAPSMQVLTLRGERIDCGRVELGLGLHLEGTVRDEAGQPCADLVVRATSARPTGEYADGGLAALTTSTDAAGRYRLEGLAAGPVHVLAFGGSAWPPCRGQRRFELLTDGRCDLTAQRVPFLQGCVLGEDGTPLPGWRVATLPHDLPLAAFAPFWQGQTTTAADGSFRLNCRTRSTRVAVFAPTGDGSVWPVLVRDCSSAATAVAETTALVLRVPGMGSGGRVGRVVAGPLALADSSLRLEHACWPLPQPLVIAADGSYRLPALGAGRYVLRLQRPGVHGEVSVAFDGDPLDGDPLDGDPLDGGATGGGASGGGGRVAPAPTLVWEEPARLRLRAHGAGDDGATFQVIDDAGRPVVRGQASASASDRLSLVPGRYHVLAWAADGAPVRRTLCAVTAQDLDLDLDLPRAAPCRVDIDCNDLGSPWVQRGPLAVLVADAQGRALLCDLLPGRETTLCVGLPAGAEYEVQVVSACGRRCQRRFTVGAGDTDVPLALP